ncbi:hypothetical protein F5Y15DRAFT_257179 [Xylariaceae sp. FL0016]|nr:hypothetical protein F5Y15DRAFT_257179 [Xylariaceae sp. FL0016]
MRKLCLVVATAYFQPVSNRACISKKIHNLEKGLVWRPSRRSSRLGESCTKCTSCQTSENQRSCSPHARGALYHQMTNVDPLVLGHLLSANAGTAGRPRGLTLATWRGGETHAPAVLVLCRYVCTWYVSMYVSPTVYSSWRWLALVLPPVLGKIPVPIKSQSSVSPTTTTGPASRR